MWNFQATVIRQKASKRHQQKILNKDRPALKNVVLGQIKLDDLVQERLEKVRKDLKKNTAAKRTTEKKTVSAATAVEVKPEVSTTEAEVSEVKAEDTAEEVKAAEVKPAKTTAKKTTKTTAKKETETKTTRAAKVSAPKIVLQMGGKSDLSMDDLVDRVKAAYAAEGHSASSVKNVEIYIKPEESMAYYVIDGYASGISLY